MTDEMLLSLEVFAERIEREVYHRSIDIMTLREIDFRTHAEGDLARASKRLRDAADYIDKNLTAIAATRKRVA